MCVAGQLDWAMSPLKKGAIPPGTQNDSTNRHRWTGGTVCQPCECCYHMNPLTRRLLFLCQLAKRANETRLDRSEAFQVRDPIICNGCLQAQPADSWLLPLPIER